MSNQFSPFPQFSQRIDCHFEALDETPETLSQPECLHPDVPVDPPAGLRIEELNTIDIFFFCWCFSSAVLSLCQLFPRSASAPVSSSVWKLCSVLRNSRCTSRREWEEVSNREKHMRHPAESASNPHSPTPPCSRLEPTEQEASPASQSTACIGSKSRVCPSSSQRKCFVFE